ncbi:MAG: hypothetical protein HY077_13340 [Elusimicrobia bacterium]|nr:hypothetical protein [Elusimicrobiota bacterium]
MVPLLLLAAAELICFGPFSSRLGFYHDDWINLERLSDAGGLFAGVRYYAHLVLERPVNSLQYPLLFALGGLHPLPYQLFYLAAETLEGWLLFILLKRLTDSREFSLLAAAVILIFPTHAVTHCWLSSSAMVVTVDLTLASLLLHLRWLEGRRVKDLAASQLLYLVGLLNYEIAAFLPLMLAGASIGRGRPVKESLAKLWPYAASLGAALLWQRAVVSLFLNRNPRLVGFSLRHALKAYEAGFECAANRAVDVCWRMAPVGAGLGGGAILAAAAFAAAAGLLLSWGKETKFSARAALGAAAGAFIGACAPFAASADYTPMVFGVMSRTNGVIAIGAGLLWAIGLNALARRSRGSAGLVFGAVVFCMTLANWGHGLQWARSWRLQTDILKALTARAEAIDGPATILLADAPGVLDPGGALVFGAHWDIGPALRLSTGRKDLSADAAGPGTQFLADAVEPRPGIRYSYSGLYLYSYRDDVLYRLTGPNRRLRI